MLNPTHVFFALALAYVLRFPLIPAAVGGALPDLDVAINFAFPWVHRGIIHTPLVVGLGILVIHITLRNRGLSLALGLGWLAHLLLDTITPAGIMWLYPVATYFSLNLATYSSLIANVGIVIWSLVFMATYRFWVVRNG